MILFTATLPPFSSRISSVSTYLKTHHRSPFSPFCLILPYRHESFLTRDAPSLLSSSLASPPHSFHPSSRLSPTLCPARLALLTIALTLSSSLSLTLSSTGPQNAKDRQRGIGKEGGRGRERGSEREREGKRWGWLSPVLRDAHQSTQSHGRAIATVSVKGIVRIRHSFDFFQVPREIFPCPFYPFARPCAVRFGVIRGVIPPRARYPASRSNRRLFAKRITVQRRQSRESAITSYPPTIPRVVQDRRSYHRVPA